MKIFFGIVTIIAGILMVFFAMSKESWPIGIMACIVTYVGYKVSSNQD